MPHFVDTSHVALYPLIIPGFADTFDPDTAFFTDLSSPLACFGSANSSLFWTADMAPKASRTAPETPQKRRPIIACQRCRKRKIKCDPGEDGAPCLTCKQGNVPDSCKYFRVGSEDAQTLLEDNRVKGFDAFKDPTQPTGRNRKAARTPLITSPSRFEHAEALSSPGIFEYHRHSQGRDLDRSRAEYGPIMYMPALPQYQYEPRTASMSSAGTQRTASLMSFHSSSYSSNDTMDDNDYIHLQPLQHISIIDQAGQQTARRTLPPISTTIAFPSVNDRSCRKQPPSYCNSSLISPRDNASARDAGTVSKYPRTSSQIFDSLQTLLHYQHNGSPFQAQHPHMQQQHQQQQHRPSSQQGLDYLASVATARPHMASEPSPLTQTSGSLPGFNSLINWGPGYSAAAQSQHGATHNHNHNHHYHYSPPGYGPSHTSSFPRGTMPSTGSHHHFAAAPMPPDAPPSAFASAISHSIAQQTQQPHQMFAQSPVGYGSVQSLLYGPTLSAVRSAVPPAALAGPSTEGVGSNGSGGGSGARGFGKLERNRTRS